MSEKPVPDPAHIAAVEAANARFYDAMRRADLEVMEALLAQSRQVTCTHPGSPMLVGREHVLASWARIFQGSGPIPIREANVEVILTGGSAMVLCHERIGGAVLMASNSYVLQGGDWRMLNHQAVEMGG